MSSTAARLAASAGDGFKTLKGLTMNTTIYPATVRELGDMAVARGMKITELLSELQEELGAAPWPTSGSTAAATRVI
jgi:hypothetical protein